jgi:DNA-directed RNA polymerase sigma subunit (sigma70/sigma32)
LLDRLPTRKRQVIELRFGLNGNGMHTLKEAGDVLGGLTPERVRQIELSALRILRTPKSPRLPEVYGPPAPYRPVNRALILDDDLWRHCDKLTKAERALIELRYGPRHRSTADIAAVFGVTEGESIEMETRAMAHLRELAEGGR